MILNTEYLSNISDSFLFIFSLIRSNKVINWGLGFMKDEEINALKCSKSFFWKVLNRELRYELFIKICQKVCKILIINNINNFMIDKIKYLFLFSLYCLYYFCAEANNNRYSFVKMQVLGILKSAIISILLVGMLPADGLASSINNTCQNIKQALDPGEDISIYSECSNGEITFTITNNKDEPSDDFILSIVEDDIIILLKKKIKMNAYESLYFTYPDEGVKYDVSLDFYTNSKHEDVEKTFYSCINNSYLKKAKTKIYKDNSGNVPSAHGNVIISKSNIHSIDEPKLVEQGLLISKFYELNGEIKVEILSPDVKNVKLQIFNLQGNTIWNEKLDLNQGINVFTFTPNEKLNQSLILVVQDRTLLLSKYLLLFY